MSQEFNRDSKVVDPRPKVFHIPADGKAEFAANGGGLSLVHEYYADSYKKALGRQIAEGRARKLFAIATGKAPARKTSRQQLAKEFNETEFTAFLEALRETEDTRDVLLRTFELSFSHVTHYFKFNP